MSNIFQMYRDEASRIRGEIINCTIGLERLIDECIALYFCANHKKALELQELIISDRMDFSKKTDAICTIMRKKCEKLKIDFNKEYPRIKKTFQDIYETRNRFAHAQMPIPSIDELSKYKIVLLPYKDEAKREPYTENDISKIFRRIEDCTGVIKHVYYTKIQRQSPKSTKRSRV